jgi:predicted Zn-dependent protease
VAWEERLGASIVEQVAPKATRCTDPAGQRVIDAMVATLARGPAKPLYTFRVIVVDDATVNAFAVPGGSVIVLRGLLERARSPEELAGVLAHELQHVLHRHATRALVEQASTGILMAALVGDASGLLAFAAETARTLGTLRYSRAHEEEADTEGMRMLLAARVDPAGMIAFFERMRGEGKEPSPALTYLSTHPTTEDRILRLRALARASTSPPVRLAGDDDWRALRAMCPSTRRPGGTQP